MPALAGIKILELAESASGEYCGKLLADFGADVIKVERPATGSPTRSLTPFISGQNGISEQDGPEKSGLFAYLNTNKRSFELDLTDAEQRPLLNCLLSQVDVVIDDHNISWLEKLGLSPAEVEQHYPGLVFCSISNFGLTPGADRQHAEDLNVFHSSGWGYHTPTGADPSLPPLNGAGRFLPSYEAAMEACICISAALIDRDQSELGRFIEISKQEVLGSRIDYVLAPMVAGEMEVSASRAAFDLSGPATILPCLDGFVYIWLSAPAHWDGLRELLDDTAWMDEFPDNWMEWGCTPERVATCRRHISEWLQTQSKHDAAEQAQKLGVTLVAVNNPSDLLESPQYQFREYFTELEHPVLGKAKYPTVPYRMSETPAILSSPAPLLGQHNDNIRAEFGGADAAKAIANAESKVGKAGPLAGVRVVELTKVWAGPYVGKLLAFLGAEVIRIESEGSLDVTRTYGVEDINNAPGFKSVNPQKLSAQINVKSEQGIELLLDLIKEADIFVQNLRPGAIERMGLGYERVKAINPSIVYTSMGMFGSEGPLSYQTGYAPCFAALSGLTALVGYKDKAPEGMNLRYADSTFGAAATYASTIALLHARRTGVGQFIDVSAVESMTSMVGDAIMDYSFNGNVPVCKGNSHPDMAPHGVYPCLNHGDDREWICIAVPGDSQWQALSKAMSHPEMAEDSRFNSLAARKANEAELDAIIAEWTAQHEAKTLADDLQEQGIAATKSTTSVELVSDSHLWVRDFYHQVTDSNSCDRTILGPGWKMSRGAEITRGAPNLGEHNSYIFGEVLGMDESKQQELIEAGIIK